MLLAFDVGNTTIAIGLFRGRKLVKSWKIETDTDKTADEYGALLLNLMQVGGVSAGKLTGAIISSVVPPLTPVIEEYGGPLIVLDFGTATTFDAVSAKGEYLGGAIAPGVRISAEALYLKTAKLPRIEVRKPKRAIGRTTVASMQSGLYFGYIGMVARLVEEIRKELGATARVIATGGFGGQIAAELPVIEAYEPDLVLEGLRIIHDRNRD